jgi:hypothetical protein
MIAVLGIGPMEIIVFSFIASAVWGLRVLATIYQDTAVE